MIRTTSAALLSTLLFVSGAFAQRGPGGVSNETVTDSDCKMWLDATELNIPDGANVSIWDDISLSQNTNSPTQAAVVNQPVFRSAPSASINGNPVIRFSPAQFLVLNSSSDINTNGPYTARTTFMAFRTGTDVTSRQMLWEQGGTVRGLNIYIFNGELYFGVFDFANDGDGTPAYGYTYTKVPVAPGTVYIVSHMFDGPAGALSGSVSGFLNGAAFQTINPGAGNPALNVGSLWSHPNAPGLGAINDDSYNESGAINNQTGQQPFLGDLAEFIAYDKLLNDGERIIVENYLASKYGINLTSNDFYDYQATFGNEVIGVGRSGGISALHNVSQARNSFQISANTAEFANNPNEYLLIGHDGLDTTMWTTTNAPNNGDYTQRLGRTWRADHTGDVGEVTFVVDASILPAMPTGFTKYCLVVDKSGGALPDFNSAQTEIIELENTSGSLYQTEEDIPDGAFITLAVVDPRVAFVSATGIGFEASPLGNNTATTVGVTLNYRPAIPVAINYTVNDNSATQGSSAPVDDIFNFSPVNVVSFTAGNRTSSIAFDILGDVSAEPVEDFSLSLVVGGGTTAGISIGAINTHLFTINDDDNLPKVGFNNISNAQDESIGGVIIQVNRSGNAAPAVSVNYQLRVIGGSGTATAGDDYTFTSGVLNFASGITTQNIPLTIMEDVLDETDETIILELVNPTGCDVLPGFNEHTHTIADNDTPPTVAFQMSTLTSPESNGSPFINVVLSAPSTQTVEVDYANLLTGTATDGADYTISTTGTLVFAPGMTMVALPIFVVGDGLNEGSETVNFELTSGTAINATIGTNSLHTLTITDYNSFEWLGVAGVGMQADNILWLDAHDLTYADGNDVAVFTDRSPYGINVDQGVAGSQPTMNFSGPNGKKELVFNGTTDVLEIASNNNLNTNTFARKDIIIAFSTGADITTRQIVYEQGGGTRGLNLYIDNGELHYHVWNNSNDNGANSAWGVGSATGAFFVTGSLVANTDYVATLSYEVSGVNGFLEGFLNGASVGGVLTSTPSGVAPLLYAHGDNGALAGLIGSTRFDDGTSTNAFFSGAIQEVIHYTEAPLHRARRWIVENHLAAKYDITMAAIAQKYLYATSHEYEVAGIGNGSDQSHNDARGTGMVRMNSASDMGAGEFQLWGHDNATVAMIPPPVPEFIPGIDERIRRVWRLSNTGGSVGSVTVTFYLDGVAGSGTFLESELYLLIDSDDGDFSNAAQIAAGRSFNSATGELTFTGVTFTDGDWFTVGRQFDQLPVELAMFDAEAIEETVKLEWLTVSEKDNDYFQIERSQDAINFTSIGTVEGMGTTTLSTTYHFVDEDPLHGISYYRLKQVDVDGAFDYSDIRSVEVERTLDVMLYPNPTQGTFVVRGSDVKGSTIVVVAPSGRQLHQLQANVFGQNVSLSNCAKGMYFVYVTKGERKITLRVIKE